MNTQSILYNPIPRLDITLDSSEYYDYELGDNSIDYISYETFGSLGNLLTEDSYELLTEDNDNIIY